MYAKFEKLMKEQGVTTAQVSKATNIDPSTFSHWKSGLYTPKLDKLVRIARYFDVPIEFFID